MTALLVTSQAWALEPISPGQSELEIRACWVQAVPCCLGFTSKMTRLSERERLSFMTNQQEALSSGRHLE